MAREGRHVVMKYRLPDGTESQTSLGRAGVKRNPEDAKGWFRVAADRRRARSTKTPRAAR